MQDTVVTDNGQSIGQPFFEPLNITGTLDARSSHNLIGLIGMNRGSESGGLTSGTHSNVVDTISGVAPLGGYGGPTSTQALVSTSPAIDGGDFVFSTAFDQRGFVRFRDGNNDGNGRFNDMGSLEVPEAIVVRTNDDELDPNPFADMNDLSLREALALAASVDGWDVIRFATLSPSFAVKGSTLGELAVNSPVDIVATPGTAINSDGHSRAFHVLPNTTLSLYGVTVSGGNPNDYSSFGGNIYSEGNLLLDTVEVAYGRSFPSGGGIYQTNGRLEIRNSTIANNTALGAGGIHVQNASFMLMTNSTVSSNAAGYGTGGMIITNTPTIIVNSTIANNNGGSAGSFGGMQVSSYLVAMHNTIVAGNWNTSGQSDISGNLYAGSTYNLIGTGGSGGLTSGGTNHNQVGVADPGLTSLNNYGGSTRTQALRTTPVRSVAIDAGSDAVALAFGLLYDQRGSSYSRKLDGDGDSTAHVDIGAVEVALGAMYS